MLVIALVFIFGLFIGSFLNVVIFRLHRKETFIKGFSKCLFCGHRLYTKDLVPLFSYLYLKGHCRYCRQRFSHQYPLVELATGLIFALIYWHLLPSGFSAATIGQIWQVVFWWIMTAFLVIIFVYDLKYYLILDVVVLPAIVLAFIGNLFLGANIFNLLLAAVVASGFFLLQFVVSRGTWIGGGDIRLGFLMGALLGWRQILVALFLAYVIGALFCLVLLAFRRKQMSDKIPFGTFLSLATILTILFGEFLSVWYLSLLQIYE